MRPYHQAQSDSLSVAYTRLSRRFFETEPLSAWLQRHYPSCSRRNFPTTTRCCLTRSSRMTQENQWRLGGINRKDGGRLFPSIQEGFAQVAHGVEGVIIKQRSHPFPQPTFAPQFGPHR